MSTRITSELMNNNLLAALNQTEQSQNTALSQVETQQRVNVPSDDPAAAALFSLTQSQNASATQYLQNISSLTGTLQTGDSALASAVSAMTQAVTLGTEGANGTLSLSDEQALGQQVQQIQSEMINIANTTFQGSYVFAGTASGPAYVANAASPDGVTYQGNTNTNTVQVAPGASVQMNVPGSQIFQNASGSVFQSLQDLATALNSGDTAAAQTAVTGVQSALSQLSQQRVFYGATVNQLSSTQTYLNNQQTNLAQQQQTLVGANLANSLTSLTTAETARQAILAAAASINQQSLLTINGG